MKTIRNAAPGLPAAATAALLFTQTFGLALPHALEVRQVATVNGFNPSDVSEICALTADDPVNTWRNSGASVFLDSEIQKLGQDNWANRLDQTTTDGGSQGISNLDCADLGLDSNCAFPTVQCQFFTPPSLFFIRNAMATAHGLFSTIASNLFANTVVSGLKVDTIVQQFGPNSPALSNPQIFSATGGAVSAASAIFGGLLGPLAERTLDAVSSALQLASSLTPDPSDTVTAQVNDQLASLFVLYNEGITNLTETVFGGVEDTSKLPGVDPNNPGPNGETTNIAKFFASGKFLSPVTDNGKFDTALQPIFKQSLQLMQQFIIGETLKASNLFILGDASKSADDCSQITGAAMADNICFYIAVREPGAAGGADSTAPLASSTAALLTDPSQGYNFNLSQFYGNANQCQQDNSNFDGQLSGTDFTVNDAHFGLPPCYFSIPVFQQSPCAVINANNAVPSNFPSNLGFTFDSCQTVAQSQGARGGGTTVIGGHGP